MKKFDELATKEEAKKEIKTEEKVTTESKPKRKYAKKVPV